MLGEHGLGSEHLLVVLNDGHNLCHGLLQGLVLHPPLLAPLAASLLVRALVESLFAARAACRLGLTTTTRSYLWLCHLSAALALPKGSRGRLG